MIIFFLLCPLFAATMRVNPSGPTVVNDYTECVGKLIEYNFDTPGFVIFANTMTISTPVAGIRAKLLKLIHSKLKYSVQIKRPKNKEVAICDEDINTNHLNVVHMDQFEAIPIADYFIVVVDDYQDFTRVISRITRSRSWNPNAKFIILFFHFALNDNINKQFIEMFMTCLFRYNVLKVIIVVPEVSNIRNAVVYSWRPYDPPKYCGYYNETAKNRLLIETTCEQGVVKTHNNTFNNGLPSNMQGCKLQILAIERQPFVSSNNEDPNIEKIFINQMAEIYHYETEYKIINSFRGERNEKGEWDGALKELSAKKGQILLGGIFPDFDVHEDFECSNTYLADAYTWIVPRAVRSPKWLALFIIFQHTVWYCVIAGFFVCVLVWQFLGNFSNDSFYHKTFRHCLLNTWITHVGFCAYARPVKTSLRVFYVFFNIYCILFLTGYQTKLIDVLTNPTFEGQIDSVEKLVKSDLKFGGFEELHDLFHNSSDPFDYFIGEKWIDVENITEALIDVAVHRNFSLLCSRLELAHLSAIMSELSDSSGAFKYFAFERDVFSVPMEMVALRGFAFIKYFSRMLERFKQMGVNSGVRRHYAQLNARKRATLLRTLQKEQLDVNPLSIEHLQGGFMALGMGFISGTTILFVEIIMNIKYVRQNMLVCKKKVKLIKRF